MTTFDVSYSTAEKAAAELLLLPVFHGPEPGPGVPEVSEALGVDLLAAMKDSGSTGKLGDTLWTLSFGRLKARVVLLVGLGPKAEAGPAQIRRAALRVARDVARYGRVATTLAQVGDDPRESAHALAEGVLLGAYRFVTYKGRPADGASKADRKLDRVTVLMQGAVPGRKAREGVATGTVYAESANWARDLVNTPAIDATPDFMAKAAQQMAKEVGLRCKVWTKPELLKGGFGGILGVGSGSANEPRFVELTYQGAGRAQPLAITGKGITFDSGGLSIKPAQGMMTMKSDMGGAAATLAAMRAIALLKPMVNVISAIPFSENMPGGAAIRPGDVLHHRGGKTSEVLNTDAEGRLVLADSLAFLSEKKPALIIDSATLTGAAVVAVGVDLWAVMGNDRDLIDGLLDAGRIEGEPGWELPLWVEYRRLLDSSVADVKNIGGRWGGAITAGLFLREFVDPDVPWAHLDVASTAFVEKGAPDWPEGATGSPARTILRFVLSRANGG